MSAAAITGEQHLEAGSTQKWLIAFAVMLGTTLEVLDTSIVNVALPHMQGTFSASVDEIAWVVTSYLVANGIMIPMTGWISSRFGRKRYFMVSVTVFVAASGLCGAATSLNQMVIFRPTSSGRGWCRDGPVLAGDPDGNFSAGRAATRDGDVGRRADGRTHHGADAGRMDH